MVAEALSPADRRRALMRAAEWEAKCLVIGGGNLQRGAWRLTLMERRAALAIESAKPARVAGRGRSQRPQGDTAA